MEILERLQRWYLSNCNGSWEHEYGISIDTLDNPGWSLVIGLTGTDLSSVPFNELVVDRSSTDWVHCRLDGQKFEGFGGPSNLTETLLIFLDWAEDKAGRSNHRP